LQQRSRRLVVHWIVPIGGIVVVLAVFSGMSAPAMKVGLGWLIAGLAYGLVLRAKHREELHASL
jgi:hypothetical protein